MSWKVSSSVLVLTLAVGGVAVSRQRAFAVEQGEIVSGTEFGEPLAGINAREFELFRLGRDDFTEVETPGEGLGPVFNGLSCAQCHSVPAVGGSGTVTEVRAGVRGPDGAFRELPGGTVFQMFSIPPHHVQNLIPPEANVIAHRKSLPLFGLGLVEAVPDAVLAALEDPEDRDGDGVSGRAHWVEDRASGRVRVGRFGWKAQQATLLAFGAEAYRDEMGITSELFPDEVCPGGDCVQIALVDPVRDPEDRPDRNTGLRGIDNFENYMRLLGPPPSQPANADVRRGEQLFQSARCHVCHTPSLPTGPSPVQALSLKRFFPYSDFLLHDIGTGDGIVQGNAGPEEIRTPPLWGAYFRAPFLHDGRAATLREAIERHRAEAENSRRLFEAFSEAEKAALLSFLESL